MEELTKLNFPPYGFRITKSDTGMKIWDGIRRRWLVLTPEEWVRQHLTRFLSDRLSVPPALIKQECPVSVQGMPQRADLVVFGRDGRPLLLAECKAPGVAVDGTVYAQAVRYNAVLGAKFILITNGLRHFIHEMDTNGNYRQLSEFPESLF